MTNRGFLKCEVCGSVTIIRVQVGWLDWHPLIIPCGKCHILISGVARFDQQRGRTSYEYHNAVEVPETRPDFYLEISGELPTGKLRKWEGDDFVWSPPPFFQAHWAMGDENYDLFKSRTLSFLEMSKKLWPTVRRVNELWNSGQTQYLAQEVHKHLPRKQFPMNNDAEMVRGVHQINLLFFHPILDNDYFERTMKELIPSLVESAKNSGSGFIDLLKYFSESSRLRDYEGKILLQMQRFVDLFRSIIPAFVTLFVCV